jgi:hypothetical protein
MEMRTDTNTVVALVLVIVALLLGGGAYITRGQWVPVPPEPRRDVSEPRRDIAEPFGPGRCKMGPPYQGEIGYEWSDGRCHHLPPN